MLLLALRFWSEKTRFMCTVPQAPPQKSSSELPTTEESIQTLPGTTRGGGSLSCGGLQQDQKWCSDSSGSFWPSLGLLEQGSSHLGRTLLRQYLLWNSLWHCFSWTPDYSWLPTSTVKSWIKPHCLCIFQCNMLMALHPSTLLRPKRYQGRALTQTKRSYQGKQTLTRHKLNIPGVLFPASVGEIKETLPHPSP